MSHADQDEDDTAMMQRPSNLAVPASRPALTVLVLREGGVSTYVLPATGEILVGRGTECDLCIDDPKLSRLHLQFRVGSRIEITDLGSRNGTMFRGQALRPHEPVSVTRGDSIGAGSTLLVLQSSNAAQRPRHVWAHGYFEARVEDECARSADRGGSFAVIRIRALAPCEDSVLEEILAAWLQPTDTIGKYAPNDFEVLRAEVSSDDALRATSEIKALLTAAGVRVAVGVATYPQDGRTPERRVLSASVREAT